MFKRRAIAVGAITGALVLLPALSAAAAPSVIANGDFQVDDVDSTTITGWTSMNQLIDLGATTIAGCVAQDTSDYTTLRDYESEAEGVLGTVTVDVDEVVLHPDTNVQIWVDANGDMVAPNTAGAWAVHYGEFTDGDGETDIDFYLNDGNRDYAIWETDELDNGTWAIEEFIEDEVEPLFSTVPDPSVRQDNVPGPDDADFWDDTPGFETTITDEYYDYATDEYLPLENGNKALKLSSDFDSNEDGYVAHGPAVYSDVFTVSNARTISLDWMAAAVSDDYHVLGYVLNVATCEQTEVLDSTGESQAWTTASVNLTTPGDYRFVFVAGSYDYSWGGAAGAELLIDNIRSTVTINGTGLDLALDLDLGQPVGGATVQLTGGGLQPNSAWTAVMRSEPVTLATGVADAGGNFFQLAQLPANVEPGRHSITLTGIRPDGSPITDVAYITVAANGTLLYLSFDGPEGTGAALAATGADTTPFLAIAGALLVGGAALTTVSVVRRRKRTA
ncbi:hypothetical protein ACFSBZ_12395 [Amnibacterium flavum]|uniref:Gram-positive cocci surface proteins LPxTG domain-containing protein n=1 Tax=Amnibacterium flavum TaxID=2173173 RepID=A0A2V1HV43_9MICO|nr:hypothetical protein [Amnibacterium flavum]PVZ95592.1 hypothetical protein DDQ50_03600 [Amnibacterium flavum]